MRMITVSSGAMTSQGLISAAEFSEDASQGFAPIWLATAAASASVRGNIRPSAKPPPTVKDVTMKRRRSIFGMEIIGFQPFLPFGGELRRAMNRVSHAGICPAPAQIGDLRIDIGVGRVGLPGEKPDRRHDLTGLTVTALGNIAFAPGLLHGMSSAQALDRRHFLPGNLAGLCHARAHGLAVHMDRAGSAHRYAASVFRSSQTDRVPDHPQEWCLGLYIHRMQLPVDLKRKHDVT